jgi:hypothetical protein
MQADAPTIILSHLLPRSLPLASARALPVLKSSHQAQAQGQRDPSTVSSKDQASRSAGKP